MPSQIQVILFRLSDPRRIALVFSALFIILTLTGCGDVIPACPDGGSGAGCGGG